ncbi:hypothetical protein DSLASN_00820 [Desulfoluna limicola]|uniref:GP-PDE domain-containing protein n=1 Tax=Desulfoluna limicola TaxID=2810562 RepID=A0ABM7PBB6_9BACT|nr:glycerophosphodiester phosphodiesterase [Desulfoluna limicola]BCS94450.1 hypothetical protein DSLASN_00820 [Desulfoluna limicola]
MRIRQGLFAILLVLVSLAIMGCDSDLTPDNTIIVVSDGVTGEGAGANEILPNAIVYKVADKESEFFAKLLTAEKVEGANVQFYARSSEGSEWVKLGGEYTTGEDGKVALDGLGSYLAAKNLLNPGVLQLKARASHPLDTSLFVEDSLGIVRVLAEYPDEGEGDNPNPQVIFADHDNTVHATGGLNAIQDWINFLNVTKGDWPYVDDKVKGELDAHLEAGKDLVLITGMSPEIRYLCRQQMIDHFEKGNTRAIPIIVKEDLPYPHSPEFKAECLKTLKHLYGASKCLAMVGDTVRQDGYGAIANDIFYIPYQVNYEPDFWLLDTEGYGWIHPDTVVNNWEDVMQRIADGPKERPNYFMKHHTGFKNIAHRGGGELAPENTLVAYRKSMAVGADTLEADVHMTSDKVVVVSHDETVDRCTDGTGAIMGMTSEELRALDAGYWYTSDGGATYPWRGKGLTLPTLEEVFSDAELNQAPMVLEIKQEGAEIVEKVLDLIAAYDMQHKLILGGFDDSTLGLIKEMAAVKDLDIKTIFATDGVLEFTFTPLSIMQKPDYEMPADVLCLPNAMMTQVLMSKIRTLGMKCYVWTVNTEIEMKRQMDWLKVDGIMTDNPQRLEAVIEE